MWLQGEAFATVMKVRMYTRCTILVLNLIRMYVYFNFCLYVYTIVYTYVGICVYLCIMILVSASVSLCYIQSMMCIKIRPHNAE